MTTVTTAIRGPVSSNVMPQGIASVSAPPPMSSSTVITTMSSAITSMAVAIQAEHSLRPVCSEMGASQSTNGIWGTAETITPVPEDLVRGVNSIAGAHPEVAVLGNQSSCGPMLGGLRFRTPLWWLC